MNKITNRNAEALGSTKINSKWHQKKEYYLLQLNSTKQELYDMMKKFNDKSDNRFRLFLISAKAGGVGVNLIGANRCVVLDTSWNPAIDLQSIFRIYRMGQEKPCYIYRLVAAGTMEEKIYSRSVTKQAMSRRVIDKQQVDRKFTIEDIDNVKKLYELIMPDFSKRPQPNYPEDAKLQSLLQARDGIRREMKLTFYVLTISSATTLTIACWITQRRQI